jgi:class 3 adenylate cyclase
VIDGATTISEGRPVRAGARAPAARRSAFLLALLALACADPAPAPQAEDGRIDLSRWDFAAGSVDLAGRWSVCWGQLLPAGAACPSSWATVNVRGLWSDESARSPFGGKGVATYRLVIDLPQDEGSLVLSAGAPMSAYRLWIDGEPVGGAGAVGTSAATTSSVPRRNRVFALPRDASQAELWVQIANFEFRGGGIRRPWTVGRADAIQTSKGQGLLRDMLLCAVSGVVGLAFLVQFGLRPRETARGYFGLFALLIALRSIPASITDLSQLLVPWASLAELMRFEYLGTALVIFAGAGYFHTKVPGVTPPRTMRALQAAGLALAPIALLAPFPLVLETLPFFLVLPPFILGLVIVCYGHAWWRGVPGVGVTLVASLVFLAAVVHDVVRTSVTDFGLAVELFPYFVVVWLLAEGYELARDFARTFERVEALSDELAEANFELQEAESAVARFVPFDFLTLLGKRSIREVAPGDHARSRRSVLHCDMQALATITEKMSDEEAFRIVNELVRAMESPVYHNGGFVNAYRGEGLQALFPDPDAAVAAAVAILDAVRAFERERRARGLPTIDVGIGIDTGVLLLGTLGEEEHLMSGVLGAAVTGAARIAASTRGIEARLLVSASTREGLSDASPYTLRALAGEEPLVVYEVLEGRGDGGPADPR